MEVDWLAFAKVFTAAFTGAVSIVLFYSLGMRMLVRAGRIREVASSACRAAIQVTRTQRRVALVLALACFALCASAVVGGLLLILVGY